MKLDQLTFLAGAAEAVQSRNTQEMRVKGGVLIWLAEQIEIANEAQKKEQEEQPIDTADEERT